MPHLKFSLCARYISHRSHPSPLHLTSLFFQHLAHPRTSAAQAPLHAAVIKANKDTPGGGNASHVEVPLSGAADDGDHEVHVDQSLFANF